jgi:hypothetical protein
LKKPALKSRQETGYVWKLNFLQFLAELRKRVEAYKDESRKVYNCNLAAWRFSRDSGLDRLRQLATLVDWPRTEIYAFENSEGASRR